MTPRPKAPWTCLHDGCQSVKHGVTGARTITAEGESWEPVTPNTAGFTGGLLGAGSPPF